MEEGLLIGSQVLLSDGLSAFGLLPHHLRSSFTTQLLRRLVRIHAELFAGSSSDLENREADPRVVSGFLLGAIVVENVHRAIRALHHSDPNWIQVLGSLRSGFRAPPSKSSAAYICANHVASGAPEVSAIGLRSAGLANFGCLEIANTWLPIAAMDTL